MPNFKSANWLSSITELTSLDMAGSDDGVWIRTPIAGEGFNWFDVGTTVDWFDVGATIDWFDLASEGASGSSAENWIGWTWRKSATNGLAATGGGFWIPANNGEVAFTGGASGGGLTEAEVLAISEGAIAARIPLDWNTEINSKPASYPPDSHTHLFADLTGVAPLSHTHLASEISNLSAWLGGQIIDFSQIANMVYPDSDVVSVNGQTGVVDITAASIAAAELVHTHISTSILDWDVAFENSFNSLFTGALEIATISYDRITNVAPALTNYVNILETPADVGFLYKNGANFATLVNGELLLEIASLATPTPNPVSGYIYFDGTNIILESSNNEELIAKIATMVSAAWEQIREAVTFGKIPLPNFINLH